jgi:hypothetical protein
MTTSLCALACSPLGPLVLLPLVVAASLAFMLAARLAAAAAAVTGQLFQPPASIFWLAIPAYLLATRLSAVVQLVNTASQMLAPLAHF